MSRARPDERKRWRLFIPGTVHGATGIRDNARFAFLCVVQEIEPEVLRSLADAVSMTLWATRWHLNASWVVDCARATREDWRTWPALTGQAWSESIHVGGGWAAEGVRSSGPAAYREQRHFEWLARVLVRRERYSSLAIAANISPQTVQQGCAALAAFIGLPLLPPARRGRPVHDTIS